jgi:hypothetical protein
LSGAQQVQEKLTEIRAITDRNARGVKKTLAGSSGLLENAVEVRNIVSELAQSNSQDLTGSSGGRQRNNGKSNRSRTKTKQGESADNNSAAAALDSQKE